MSTLAPPSLTALLTSLHRFNPSGAMLNGAHEGYPGLRILQSISMVKQNGYLDRKPNIVLIHVGSNNCLQNLDYITGAQDLEDFANYLYGQIPGVAIIMSTLGPLWDSDSNSRCKTVLNPDIRDTVYAMQQQGKNVHLADFGGGGYISIADIGEFGADNGIHPTEAGYGKYAEIWHDAISLVYQKNLIGPVIKTAYPDHSDGTQDNTCKKVAGQAYGPVNTQYGKAGEDDGAYTHSSTNWGPLIAQKGGTPLRAKYENDITENVMFAQLIGEYTPDRNMVLQEVVVFISADAPNGNGTLACEVATNFGDGIFSGSVPFDVHDGPGCLVEGLHWADINSKSSSCISTVTIKC